MQKGETKRTLTVWITFHFAGVSNFFSSGSLKINTYLSYLASQVTSSSKHLLCSLHLLLKMNMSKRDCNGWVLCPSQRFPGKFYFFNTLSGEAVWSLNELEVSWGVLRHIYINKVCEKNFGRVVNVDEEISIKFLSFLFSTMRDCSFNPIAITTDMKTFFVTTWKQ